MKNRNTLFDVVKYISILMVVFGHCITAFGESSESHNISFLLNISHMPVFYFISGYFLFRESKKYSPLELLKKKTVRLMIPYLIWSAVSFLMNIALLMLRGGISAEIIGNEAAEIFLCSRSVWFLIELFIASAVFIFCHELSARARLPLISVLLSVYLLLFLFGPDTLFSFFKFRHLFPFMVIGYYIGSRPKEDNVRISEMTRYIKYLSIPALIFFSKAVFAFDIPDKMYYSPFTDGFAHVAEDLLFQIGGELGVIAVFSVSALLCRLNVKEKLAERGCYSLDISYPYVSAEDDSNSYPRRNTGYCKNSATACDRCCIIGTYLPYLLLFVKKDQHLPNLYGTCSE